MNSYQTCASCRRYVKQGEPICPFCRATQRASSTPWRPRPSTSRVRLLAYGSALTALGCNSSSTPDVSQSADATAMDAAPGPAVEQSSPEGDATPVADVAEEAAYLDRTDEASVDGGPQDGPSMDGSDNASFDGASLSPNDGGIIPSDGGFTCRGGGAQGGNWVCDRATQWCFSNNGGYGPSGCRSLDDTCIPAGSDAASCWGTMQWDASACAGGYLRCACATADCVLPTCTDDGLGGVTMACGMCYGAPPAK
jgi:hypothetical protein